MTIDEKKLEILRKVEDGSLTVEEAAARIADLETAESQSLKEGVSIEAPDESSIPKHETSGCWKAAWSMILVGGAILSAFSAYWMVQGYQKHAFGWGFWLSWLPMLIGIGLMLFGWALMESPWMHVRVHGMEQHKFSGIYVFSMPVPFNIARWVIRNFSQYMPEEVKADEVMDILDQAETSIRNGEPFQVQVDSEKDGTKVDIFIN